jgi:hypothetical protein
MVCLIVLFSSLAGDNRHEGICVAKGYGMERRGRRAFFLEAGPVTGLAPGCHQGAGPVTGLAPRT